MAAALVLRATRDGGGPTDPAPPAEAEEDAEAETEAEDEAHAAETPALVTLAPAVGAHAAEAEAPAVNAVAAAQSATEASEAEEPPPSSMAEVSASGGTHGKAGGSTVAFPTPPKGHGAIASARLPSSALSSVGLGGNVRPWHTNGSGLLWPDALNRDRLLPGGETERTLPGRMHSSGPKEPSGPGATSTGIAQRGEAFGGCTELL